MIDAHLLHLKANRDEQYGTLVAAECDNHDIPFIVKRVYYIFDVPHNCRRGFHAHKQLRQLLICTSGTVSILLKTPKDERVVVLDSPTKALYVGQMVWREMFNFSENAVLVVMASEHYNTDDYIRDYSKFCEQYKAVFNGEN